LLGGGRRSACWIRMERAGGATLGDSLRGKVGDWERLTRWGYLHINPHNGVSPRVGTRRMIWVRNGILIECSEFGNQGGHISALPSALRYGHLFSKNRFALAGFSSVFSKNGNIVLLCFRATKGGEIMGEDSIYDFWSLARPRLHPAKERRLFTQISNKYYNS